MPSSVQTLTTWFYYLPSLRIAPFALRTVIVGYGLGMLIILGVSWLIAWIAHLFPPEYVGFLGVIPILLGLKRLYQQFIRHSNPAEAAPVSPSTHSQIVTVALADVAHGADTITLFAALLAESDVSARFAVTFVYLLLGVSWCCLGFLLIRHPRVRKPVERYGHRLSGFMLIGVGVYIVLNTVHDVTFR